MHRALPILVALAMPALALAAGGGGEAAHGPLQIPWTGMALHAINLSILIGVLYFVTRTPIADGLKDRAASIRQHLTDSNQLRKEAQARYDELEQRLQRFDKEVEKLRGEALAHSEAEKQAIAARTEDEVARITAAAQRTIRDETAAARKSLHDTAVRLAVAVAEERLRDQFGDTEQTKLTQDLLGSIREEAPGHG